MKKNYLFIVSCARKEKRHSWRLEDCKVFVLLFVMCFGLIPSPVYAQEQVETQVLKFFLDPALVPDIEIAKAVLPKYAEDINTILAKNTNRRLIFNPEVDIIVTSTQPFSNQAQSPLPADGFEIWAYAVQSEYPYSYGGYGGLDSSGAGVLAGLKWVRLYDPDKLSSAELSDYWTQINNMLHELAHIFGAGMGEYYRLSNVQDTTGIFPLLNINVLDPNDSFWKSKSDFLSDPLLRNAAKTIGPERLSSRQALLSFVKFSDLTAAIISGDYRNTVPTIDLQHITVSVVDEQGMPLRGVNIKIWSVTGIAYNPSNLLVDRSTDANGQIVFEWGGSPNPHNNLDFLRLIKAYKGGYVASAKYLSIFDADILKIVQNNNFLDISMALKKEVHSFPIFLPTVVKG